MRIALVIQNAEPARGGAERYTLNLAADLVARGHEVHLLAQRFARNVEPARQVHLEGAAGTRVRRYEMLLDSLDQHLTQQRYDVVHAMLPVRRCDIYHPHAGIEQDNLSRGHLKHASPLRRLISRMGNALNTKRRLFARTEAELVRSSKPPLVLCLSDYVRQAALRYYPQQAQHMPVLHNGVDLARFNPSRNYDIATRLRVELKIPPAATVALIIANDYRRKGLATAIRALGALTAQERQNARLLVVGRGETAAYQALARRLRVAANVIFAGPARDAVPFYQCSDFFILPTHHDPCSLVVLEALAMGLPNITTRCNGAGEVIRQGEQGFVLPDANDHAAFADSWRQLLHAATLERMRATCLALRPQISQDRHVERLLKLYEQVRSR